MIQFSRGSSYPERNEIKSVKDKIKSKRKWYVV